MAGEELDGQKKPPPAGTVAEFSATIPPDGGILIKSNQRGSKDGSALFLLLILRGRTLGRWRKPAGATSLNMSFSNTLSIRSRELQLSRACRSF